MHVGPFLLARSHIDLLMMVDMGLNMLDTIIAAKSLIIMYVLS